MKGGQIIQVQGGHIIRSTGRKDRHSKVYTTKGPRDRRVRLSAHTAIQFYDVQDRLGYDRPSKALDWLIQNAKNAINELPPWNPDANKSGAPSPDSNPSSSTEPGLDRQSGTPSPAYRPIVHPDNVVNNNSHNPGASASAVFMQQHDLNSMKSFFATNTANFPDFSNEDLGLSLHSLQGENHGNPNNIVGYQENFHRMDNWNHGNGNIGFVLNSQQTIPQQEFFSPFSQRELLQSNLLVHAMDQHYPTSRGHEVSDAGSHFSLGFNDPSQFYSDNGEGKNR